MARVTDELKRLRAMSPSCADAQSTELATQPAPSPVPEPCPDWIGSVREAMRRLDECQAELKDLNRQLDEREQLLTRLRAAPPVDASTAAQVLNAPTPTPCPTVNETVVTVERVVYKDGSPPQATTTPAAMPEAAMSNARPAADPAAGRARAAGEDLALYDLELLVVPLRREASVSSVAIVGGVVWAATAWAVELALSLLELALEADLQGVPQLFQIGRHTSELQSP